MLAFLTSKWGLIFIVVAVALIGFVWWTLHAEAAGAAAVVAAAAAKALERAKAANEARSKVDHSKEAETNDPFNRRG